MDCLNLSKRVLGGGVGLYCDFCYFDYDKHPLQPGRHSDGRARGSKGNARALQTDDEGSQPKIGCIWGPSAEKFLRPHSLESLRMLSRIF